LTPTAEDSAILKPENGSQNAMRDASLRWGLGLGVTAALIGVVARLVGIVLAPIPAYTTAENVAVDLIVQTVLVLLGIGIALGLSNYAGQRVERDRRLAAAQAQATEGQEAGPLPDERTGSLLAGTYVMICFWFMTALYQVLGPPLQQGASTAKPNPIQLVITGVIYALLGAGLGAWGGRAVAARALLSGVIKPAPITIPAPAAPVASPSPRPSPTVTTTPAVDSVSDTASATGGVLAAPGSPFMAQPEPTEGAAEPVTAPGELPTAGE
jgi:hypothetical protein